MMYIGSPASRKSVAEDKANIVSVNNPGTRSNICLVYLLEGSSDPVEQLDASTNPEVVVSRPYG